VLVSSNTAFVDMANKAFARMKPARLPSWAYGTIVSGLMLFVFLWVRTNRMPAVPHFSETPADFIGACSPTLVQALDVAPARGASSSFCWDCA
jgi:hypothetical protein